MNKLILFFVFLIALSAAFFNSYAQTIHYVKQGGAGTKDGTSWANASDDLQLMINNSTTNDEIWVAGGTYVPNRPANNTATIAVANRDNAFVLKSNIKIYGGFTGTETALTQRIVHPNAPSILSGDFNGDDQVTGISGTLTFNNYGENAYHLVIASGITGVTLDGFTITGSNANNGNYYIMVGNGYIYGRDGAMFTGGSSYTVRNCIFSKNNTTSGHAGISSNANNAVIVIDKCVFSQNVGAITNAYCSPTISNCVFWGNKGSFGGAIHNNISASPKIINSIFYKNWAYYGGAIHSQGSASPSIPLITNCTFLENVGQTNGGAICNSGNYSGSTISNSIFWDNGSNIYNSGSATVSVNNSIMQGGYSGTGNINSNPLFVNSASPVGEDGIWGTVDDGLRLQITSPAVNAGSNQGYDDADGDNSNSSHNNDKDLLGGLRLKEGTIDMGAYEGAYNPIPQPDANGIIYVKQNGAGTFRGDSWANAAPELADALKWARQQNNFTAANPLKIYVAKGTYKPAYSPKDGANFTDAGRNNAFLMVKDVQLYGGFDLTNGIDDLSKVRIYGDNGTILSGDIGTIGVNTDNAYHVVVASGDVGTAKLDGFTVSGGFANGGGGSGTIGGNTFIDNYGAGIYNFNASTSCQNVIIKNNHVEWDGGGMLNNASSPVLTNVVFANNGANYKGGGMANYNGSHPQLINTTIANNTSGFEGTGIYNLNASVSAYNAIFWGNQKNGNAGIAGADIEQGGSGTISLKNSITQSYNTGNPADNNLVNINPLFADAANGNYALQNESPAIGKGENSYYVNLLESTVDLAGSKRLVNSKVDVGAYENQVAITEPDANNILYVNINVVGGDGSGRNWGNAIKQLADAIKWGRQQNNFAAINPLKIYAAKGTYKPLYNAEDGQFTTDGGRNNAFVMVKNVQLYGGFDPANSISTLNDNRILPDEVSGAINTGTILSGDLGAVNTPTDNAYHVVISSGAVENAKLDGFVIRDGYGNGTNYVTVNGNVIRHFRGGGVICFSSSPAFSYISIAHNTVSASNFSTYGGGMYNESSSPTLSRVNITDNKVSSSSSLECGGGGIYNTLSLPTLNNVYIANNTVTSTSGAVHGGGIHNHVSFTELTNVTIANNSASCVNLAARGGGMSNTGAGNISLKNVNIVGNTVSGNGSAYGGGISNSNNNTQILINVTVVGNVVRGGAEGSSYGAGIRNSSSTLYVYNSIIWNNKNYYTNITTGSGIDVNLSGTLTVKNSMTQSYDTNNASDKNLIGIDPLFKDDANGDYTLQATSPAINKGDNSLYSGLTSATIDLAGNPRVFNYVNGGAIDIGAYEYQALLAQTINFAILDPKTTNSTDYALGATATSGLTVSYASSNTTVAEVYQDAADGNKWKVKIKGAGNTDITASQAGDANYNAATNVIQNLVVIEGGTLPVVLSSYTAKIEGDIAKLTWQTTSEINNKGFVIFRSGDDKQFVKIGEVPSAINQQPLANYTFTDKQPLKGKNYYKLVQLDQDGKQNELGVKLLTFNFQPSTFNVYPNPTTSKVTVTFEQGRYKNLVLSDNLGRMLYQRQIGDGLNAFSIDLSAYPIGIYFINLKSAEENVVKKVIKQ